MIKDFKPSYLKLAESGELTKRAAIARERLTKCELCPHKCGVDRTNGKMGRCKSLDFPEVASHNLHHGEEPPISGFRGSGTIFFSHCTLRCIFCQNYPISQMGNGRKYSNEDLAGMFLDLQKRGAHNINFVTPTHYVAQIIQALEIAVNKGFSLPLVYNTSGYETLETLALLEDIIDIYLPDIKYDDNSIALKYSGAECYLEYNRPALKEMFRQVGFLECDEDDIGQRGLIVRHLVLPDDLSGTENCLRFLEKELSPNIHLALMSQYFPAYKALDTPPMNKRVDPAFYLRMSKLVQKVGFDGWIQPLEQ